MDVAVEGLVSHGDDLTLASVSFVDEPTFRREIARTQPDVIVLSSIDPLDMIRIIGLLNDQPTMRVLVVRFDDNTIDVIEKHSVAVKQPTDLVEVIRGSLPSPTHTAVLLAGGALAPARPSNDVRAV